MMIRTSSLWKIVLALGTSLILGCVEIDAESEKIYESTRDAREDGAIENQRIPNWMPSDSSEIRVYSDLDVNDAWVAFRLPISSANELAARLEPLARERIGETNLVKPADIDWWPDCLTMKSIGACDDRFAFYAGDSFFVALDLSAGEGFAWRR